MGKGNKRSNRIETAVGQTNFTGSQMRQICCRKKGGETAGKADMEREQPKVVSVRSFSFLSAVSLVVVNFTVDPLCRRRLIRTYKILYWFSLYARYFPLPACLCDAGESFSTELLPHLSIGRRPLVTLTPAFTAGVRLIYSPFLFRSLRFIFKHYS